jgi:hypothetical protein
MGRLVIACYRPKAGKEEALKRLILDHVARLRAEGLVTERQPITMEAADGTVVEVFEWVSSAAIESAHSNPVVLKMWEQYNEVCDYVPIAELPEAAQLFSEFAPIAGVRHTLPRAPKPSPPTRTTPASASKTKTGQSPAGARPKPRPAKA